MSIVARAHELETEMIAVRRQLHANPELAFQEKDTTAFILKKLEEYGIEAKPNGEATGVIALLRGGKPGKTIALRADIDALPMEETTGLAFASTRQGVSHSCGHDIHTASLLGAAKLLSERREDICGSVKFLFQPAEERLSGSKSMIENGALRNPDVDDILCLHTWPELPGGSIGIRRGPALASSDGFTITITGKGGHAAHPHKCVDPIVVGASIIMQLQTVVSREIAPVDSAVISIGKLVAGTAGNILPGQATLEGTVRTLTPETQAHVRESLIRIATLTAQSLRATAEVVYTPGVPSLTCDDRIVDAISEAAAALLGEDKIVQLKTPSMGGEDFAEYLAFVPGALFRIGTADERPESQFALHNAGTVFNEQAIVTGAIVFVGTAFKLTGSDFSTLL